MWRSPWHLDVDVCLPRKHLWRTQQRYQRYQAPIPGTRKCHLTRQNLCGCSSVQDPEMGTLFQIIHVGAECNHRYPWKRETEEELTPTERRRQCDHRHRNRSDVATIQGPPAATRSWKNEPLKGMWPCQHLDFSRVTLMSDFWPPELTKNKFLTF